MPEEINRILTDAISDYLFITEESAYKNLLKEGIPEKKITNKEYRKINSDISDRTALIDLMDLVEKKVIVAKGTKKYRYYILR